LVTIFDARGLRTEVTYDGSGNNISQRSFLGDGTFLETVRSYDGDGNLLSETDPEGNTSTFTYDDRGNLLSRTDPGGRTERFTYNDCNEVETRTDPLGNVTSLTHDEDCNVTSSTNELGQITTFLYNEEGQRTGRIDPEGNLWQHSYDDRGYPTALTDPLGNVHRVSFSAAGDLLFRIDGRGRRIDYEYDSDHRLIRETWDTNPPRVITIEYDAAGQVIRASDPESTVNIEYWNTGLLKAVDYAGTPGAPPLELTLGRESGGDLLPGYDLGNNVTHVLDSAGGRTEYSYDDLNRLRSVLQTGQGQRRVDLEYTDASLVSRITRYASLDTSAPVAATTLGYDCGGCSRSISSIRHVRESDGSVIEEQSLVRDGAGNILQMTDADGVHTYTHDAAGRILTATHPGHAEQYTYDGVGNRKSSHLSTDYIYSHELGEGGNQLREDDQFTYSYDANGSLVRMVHRATGEHTDFSYDHRNRITSVAVQDSTGTLIHTASYLYDPFNLRIRVIEDGSTSWILHDGVNPLLEVDGAGNEIARRMYTRAVDGILAHEVAGASRWYLTDQVGTARQLLDDAGNTASRFTHDSFGRLLSDSGGEAGGSLLFTARPFDAQTGLGFFRFRIYNPALGRFLQRDPLYPFEYTYALNNPLLYTDPLGLDTAVEQTGILARIIGIIPGGRKTGIAVCGALALAAQALGVGTGVGQLAKDLKEPTEIVCKVVTKGK